jgi:hypothetical protein
MAIVPIRGLCGAGGQTLNQSYGPKQIFVLKERANIAKNWV